MARRFDAVVGVDVSPGMLAEARLNCARAGLENVELVESDDNLSRVVGCFDLVHSTMVFQHLAPRRGERLLRCLIQRLGAGGVAALHVTYHWPVGRFRRFKYWLLTQVPLAAAAANVLRGRPPGAPLMEMNCYSLNRLFAAVQAAGAQRLHAAFTQHHEHWGVLLVFQTHAA